MALGLWSRIRSDDACEGNISCGENPPRGGGGEGTEAEAAQGEEGMTAVGINRMPDSIRTPAEGGMMAVLAERKWKGLGMVWECKEDGEELESLDLALKHLREKHGYADKKLFADPYSITDG